MYSDNVHKKFKILFGWDEALRFNLLFGIPDGDFSGYHIWYFMAFKFVYEFDFRKQN